MAEAAIIPIVVKRAVLATWQSVNPVLKWGEVGAIIEENAENGFVQAVIGDGANDFNDLFNNNKVFLTWADLLQNKITPIVETLLDLIEDEAVLRAAGDNGNAAAIVALEDAFADLADALELDQNNLVTETDARIAADNVSQEQINEIYAQIEFINGAVVYVGSIAGEEVAAGDLLIIDATGTLFKYDYANPDHRYAVIGLAMTTQAMGEPVNVIMFGLFIAESDLFTPGASIFASQDTPGALVFALPDDPYAVQVGYSINATAAIVNVINSQINSYLEALIEAETAERIAALQDEEDARILADGIEEAARIAADLDLQDQIDAIKSVSNMWVGAAGANFGDSQTLYFGEIPVAPQAITTQRRSIYFDRPTTILGATIGIHSTVAGTNEAWSLYIRLNDTTDYLVATVSNTNNYKLFINSALNIFIGANEFIEMKLINPAWVTNPTASFIGGHLTIEI